VQLMECGLTMLDSLAGASFAAAESMEPVMKYQIESTITSTVVANTRSSIILASCLFELVFFVQGDSPPKKMAFALTAAARQCAPAAAGNGREWDVGNKASYGRLDGGPVGEAAAVCDPNAKQQWMHPCNTRCPGQDELHRLMCIVDVRQ
jgi:hypothetical protein